MEAKILAVLDANNGVAAWEAVTAVLDDREKRNLHNLLRDMKRRGIAERFLQPSENGRVLVVRRITA